jgi:serine/threonine protein kinase
MARFAREAQVLASLNHPNIAAIYGVEERALVMELVEGPTLAGRIAQGAIPLEEALPIARQIAEALEAAHEKGIVHRDLKPANIKLTAEGKVKVLDFGLARVTQASGNDDPQSSPTLTMSATVAGVILGTAAYMSPEQARGGAVDKRADIWAFGVVLYEMLTRRRVFAGDTVSDALAAVLKTEPDWRPLPAETPSAIRRLLRRCLERTGSGGWPISRMRGWRLRRHRGSWLPELSIYVSGPCGGSLTRPADCGLLSPDLASGIRRVKGVKKPGGDWETG